MRKLAIFVEGKTERVFVEKLIRLMIDEKKLKIDVFEASGGSDKLPRRIRLIHKTPDNVSHEFYIQIVECRNDERVASDVRDQYDSLSRAGFKSIIAIRDVYPDYSISEVSVLRRIIRFRIKTVPIDPIFVLGVMEIEAWFLAEHHHFPRIHNLITCQRIKASMGFDPTVDDMQMRLCPHEDLHNIYQLAGYSYRKKESHIQRTLKVLDFEYIYYNMVDKFPDLNSLVTALEAFFMSDTPPCS